MLHRLQRHGLRNNGRCTLCDQVVEMLDHLLIQCALARETWFKTLHPFSWQHLTPESDSSLVHWWLTSHKVVTKAHRKAFDSLVFAVAWSLWLECNNRVFNWKVSSVGGRYHLLYLVSY
jgi:hypothetical protein